MMTVLKKQLPILGWNMTGILAKLYIIRIWKLLMSHIPFIFHFHCSSLVPRSWRLSSRATSWRTWCCWSNSMASSSSCTNLPPPRAPCPAPASAPISSTTWRRLWPHASTPSTSPPPRAPWCDVILTGALRSNHSIHVMPLLSSSVPLYFPVFPWPSTHPADEEELSDVFKSGIPFNSACCSSMGVHVATSWPWTLLPCGSHRSLHTLKSNKNLQEKTKKTELPWPNSII